MKKRINKHLSIILVLMMILPMFIMENVVIADGVMTNAGTE